MSLLQRKRASASDSTTFEIRLPDVTKPVATSTEDLSLRKAIRPYRIVILAGLVVLVAGSVLATRKDPTFDVPSSIVQVIGDALRAIGGAAVIGSLVGPLIGKRVQREAFEDVMQRAVAFGNALAALGGRHAPPDYTEGIQSYLASVSLATEERDCCFEIEWSDAESGILEVKVRLVERGRNISSTDFSFRKLWAPASVAGYKTRFEFLHLSTDPNREHNGPPVALAGNALASLVKGGSDGRRYVDLRKHRNRTTLKPGQVYTLNQHFVVYLSSSWAYVLETRAANLGQRILVSGGARDDLELAVVVANEAVDASLNTETLMVEFRVDWLVLPGQTAVMTWRPRDREKGGPSRKESREASS